MWKQFLWVPIFIILGTFGIVHQHLLLFYIFQVDEWVDWSQLVHHEFLIGLCFGVAVWETIRPWANKLVRAIAERIVRG